MVDAKDVLLGVIGLLTTLLGVTKQDVTTTTIGIVLLFITIQLNLQSHDEDISTLKAQINTQNELKKIWTRLDEVENKNSRK